jgi:hypothetical protein
VMVAKTPDARWIHVLLRREVRPGTQRAQWGERHSPSPERT